MTRALRPKWVEVSTVRNTRYLQQVYRDEALGVQKEVMVTLRHAFLPVRKEFYLIDGDRAVFRSEGEMINALTRKNHERRQAAGR